MNDAPCSRPSLHHRCSPHPDLDAPPPWHLAAERGGNCELTHPGERVIEHGVTVIGRINVAGGVPYHASQMYARNVTAFLLHLVKDGRLQLNLNDEIIRETLVTHDGEIVNDRVRDFFQLPAPAMVGK